MHKCFPKPSWVLISMGCFHISDHQKLCWIEQDLENFLFNLSQYFSQMSRLSMTLSEQVETVKQRYCETFRELLKGHLF